MSEQPLVSVIIPTYNRSYIVGNAIQSALDQTYANKEILVVDDGSEDDTHTLVKAFPGVKYILQEHGGQAAARNTGWQNAKGIYISTLDSDDIWNTLFLEKSIAVLEQYSLDFVFSNWNQEQIEGGVIDFFSYDEYLKPYLPKDAEETWIHLNSSQLRDLYIQCCPSPSSSLVLRSSSIEKGWNKEMNIGDDWCMLLDMILSKKTKAAFTTEKLWLKHINFDNLYDGRDFREVNKLLWVSDIRTILSRHKSTLTKKEYQFIEKRYLINLIRSAKHNIFHYSQFSEGLGMMKKAITINPFYATTIFYALFLEAIKRKFKKTPG